MVDPPLFPYAVLKGPVVRGKPDAQKDPAGQDPADQDQDLPALLLDRGRTHGDFPAVAGIAQALREIYRSSPNWQKLNDVQREVFDSFAVKQARLLAGNPDFPDHIVDMIGYAELYRQSK